MTPKIGNNLILRKKSIYKHQELASFADIKKTELRALMAFDTVAYGNDGVEVVIFVGLVEKSEFPIFLYFILNQFSLFEDIEHMFINRRFRRRYRLHRRSCR
ncbi:hypothetical protein [Sphingobacterium chuzhouense]